MNNDIKKVLSKAVNFEDDTKKGAKSKTRKITGAVKDIQTTYLSKVSI